MEGTSAVRLVCATMMLESLAQHTGVSCGFSSAEGYATISSVSFGLIYLRGYNWKQIQIQIFSGVHGSIFSGGTLKVRRNKAQVLGSTPDTTYTFLVLRGISNQNLATCPTGCLRIYKESPTLY
jgi:hypothetical protein